MKRIFSHPLAIVNFALFTFLALLVLNANAERLHLPRPVQEALAAVATITGSGPANKLAAFAAVNAIGDSIITDNGSTITVGSGTGITITTSGQITTSQVNTNAIQGGGANLGLQTTGRASIQLSPGTGGVSVNGALHPGVVNAIVTDGNNFAIAGATDGTNAPRFDFNANIVSINGELFMRKLTNILTQGSNFVMARDSNGASFPRADIYTNEFVVNGRVVATERFSGRFGDYAEWFEREEDVKPGDLIGIDTQSGKARRYNVGDHFVGIYSASPIIAANEHGTDEEMVKTHVLVGLLGQLDFDRSQVVIEGRTVKTPDGVYVGVLLSNGKVLIGR